MQNSRAKPILVTGPHRSGSTWTGRMLSDSPDIGYIHEPFHIKHRRGLYKSEIDYWFTYVCDENGSDYFADLDNLLHFKYSISEELKYISSIKDLLRLVRDYGRFESFRIQNRRPLLKDPLGVFSAEWLAKCFNMDVVILCRHPAAFAGSLKKAHWTHPFDHFLRQPLLMRDRLAEFRPEIEEYARTEHDIVDQAILLWNLIHHAILEYRKSQPDWIFVKHEELSENPLEEFGKLYQRLGIHYSPDIQRRIREHSFPDPERVDARRLKLDSKANIRGWQAILTDEEVRRVKEKTREIASAFYTEEDWTR